MGEAYHNGTHEMKVEKDNGDAYVFIFIPDKETVVIPPSLYTDVEVMSALRENDSVDLIINHELVEARKM